MKHRFRRPELMDQPGLDATVHRHALRGLQRVNWMSRTARVLWQPLRELAARNGNRPLRILDVASGAGDVAVRLARRAERDGVPLVCDGCDINPVAIEHAQAVAAQRGVKGIRFFRHDVLHDPLPGNYDAVTCTLFLHHLEREDAILLLSRMAAATKSLVLVDDLRRTAFGYLLARVGGQILSRSPIVHYDGPASVAAAFTPAEALDLAAAAGLAGATLRRHWPQRFLLTWSKS